MEITLIDEFKRSWLTSIIGIALLGAGTWLLTWNEVGRLCNLLELYLLFIIIL